MSNDNFGISGTEEVSAEYILKIKNLSLDFIENNKDIIHWHGISCYYPITEEFYLKYKNYLNYNILISRNLDFISLETVQPVNYPQYVEYKKEKHYERWFLYFVIAFLFIAYIGALSSR